jgi:hypothetical protein
VWQFPKSPPLRENNRVADTVAEFGRRLNVRVAKTLALGDDFIVLLDYCQAPRENLFRLRADGSVVWTISQPPAMGAVVDVQWRYGRHPLTAWTFGCYMITLDESTGIILESEFTK